MYRVLHTGLRVRHNVAAGFACRSENVAAGFACRSENVAAGFAGRATTLCTILFALYCILACDSKPEGVMSEGQMSDVLYGLHIAQQLADNHDIAPNTADIIALRAAVLRDNGVSPAEWETSMRYYCTHTDRLHAIYKRLNERINADVIAAGGKAQGIATAEEDTANVWNQPPDFILTSEKACGALAFAIDIKDTLRAPRIRLQWQATALFQEERPAICAVLAVRFANDSVAHTNTRLGVDGPGNLMLTTQTAPPVKAIRGYFMMVPPEDKKQFAITAFNNVKLLTN